MRSAADVSGFGTRALFQFHDSFTRQATAFLASDSFRATLIGTRSLSHFRLLQQVEKMLAHFLAPYQLVAKLARVRARDLALQVWEMVLEDQAQCVPLVVV